MATRTRHFQLWIWVNLSFIKYTHVIIPKIYVCCHLMFYSILKSLCRQLSSVVLKYFLFNYEAQRQKKVIKAAESSPPRK